MGPIFDDSLKIHLGLKIPPKKLSGSSWDRMSRTFFFSSQKYSAHGIPEKMAAVRKKIAAPAFSRTGHFCQFLKKVICFWAKIIFNLYWWSTMATTATATRMKTKTTTTGQWRQSQQWQRQWHLPRQRQRRHDNECDHRDIKVETAAFDLHLNILQRPLSLSSL